MLLLYMLFMLYMTATSIQVIYKSIVKIHKSGHILEKSVWPNHLTSCGQQNAWPNRCLVHSALQCAKCGQGRNSLFRSLLDNQELKTIDGS